jgi:hypothetical protein
MAGWGSDESYDDVEKDHLAFLRQGLPQYLAFHQAYRGFLPENFNDGNLKPEDPRARALHRLGFLNYSVLVNALLVKRAAENAGGVSTMLDVYGRASAFFLRAGAVIDISKKLEAAQTPYFKAGAMSKERDTPHADALWERMKVVDDYNNFLKHNGLPATRLVKRDGHTEVEIPTDIPMAAMWKEQKPDTPLGELFAFYAPEIFAALDAFYAALVARTGEVQKDWQLTSVAQPRGIRHIVESKSPLSSSLGQLDGYQAMPMLGDLLKHCL